MNDKQVCTICGAEFEGFGHNAAPVTKGRCCDHCNEYSVIPARLGYVSLVDTEKLYRKVMPSKDFANMLMKGRYAMRSGLYELECDSAGFIRLVFLLGANEKKNYPSLLFNDKVDFADDLTKDFLESLTGFIQYYKKSDEHHFRNMVKVKKVA